MGTPLLSVVMPIYNVEPYLRRCLDSVTNQTYTNLEIICVDDGSTDASGKIADEYAQKDRRIKVIHKDNGGLVSARKAGTEIAQGPYIVHVDSDDYIESNMYEELVQLILKHDADVVTSGLIRDYGNYSVIEKETLLPGVYAGEKLKRQFLSKLVDIKLFFKTNIKFHTINKIYRTDLYRTTLMSMNDKINVGEDGAFVLSYFPKITKAVVSGKEYYHYCIRNDSIMGVKKKDDAHLMQALSNHLEQLIKSEVSGVDNYAQQIELYRTYAFLLRDAGSILRSDSDELYPFGNISKTHQILLYGAGKFGAELKQYLDKNNYDIVAWVDKKVSRHGVVLADDILNYDFDVVVIAVLQADTVIQIKSELAERGIKNNIMYNVNADMLLKKL